MSENQPIKKIQAGLIQASTWVNKGEKGDFLSHTIQRGYKDKDGKWNNTSMNYATSDISTIIMLLKEQERFSKLEYPQNKGGEGN